MCSSDLMPEGFSSSKMLNRGEMPSGDFNFGMNGQNNTASGITDWIWIAISVLVLGVGLIIVKKYKY